MSFASRFNCRRFCEPIGHTVLPGEPFWQLLFGTFLLGFAGGIQECCQQFEVPASIYGDSQLQIQWALIKYQPPNQMKVPPKPASCSPIAPKRRDSGSTVVGGLFGPNPCGHSITGLLSRRFSTTMVSSAGDLFQNIPFEIRSVFRTLKYPRPFQANQSPLSRATGQSHRNKGIQ